MPHLLLHSLILFLVCIIFLIMFFLSLYIYTVQVHCNLLYNVLTLCVNYRKKPNLIVHLDVSPAESKRRIELRQRECESTISLDYLTNLHAAYEEFMADIARIIPVIRVNYEKFRSADEMADMIVR